MAKRTKYKFSIEGRPLYPHLKITRERFPRILATRIIADDDAEYFGAFLNRTNARMLLDFLNRTFRLRSCDIDMDGSLNYPCTMHYKRRCIAPCVRDLTNESEYDEMVSHVRLFLLNDRPLFGSVLGSKIAEASDRLDFETAAKWRDILEAAEAYWADLRRSVWLDATSDTISYRVREAGIDVILISQKGRRVLGERIFGFANANESEAEQAISEVIQQFYKFHGPKEIRVSMMLSDKVDLERVLRERVGRTVRIILLTEKNRKISTELAVYRSSSELDVQRSIVRLSPTDLVRSLKREFKLPHKPERITAIDVAHTSGTDQVAAAVSWANGRMDPGGSQHWLSDAKSELESVHRFVERFCASRNDDMSELLLIDGGTAQHNAAMSADLPENISVISAVKPLGEHEAIAYFLTPAKERVEFDVTNDAHRLLQRLRDEVHDYANAVHRDTRDYANYYRMAEILPSLTESERRNLLKALGSTAKVSAASKADLSEGLAIDRVSLGTADLESYRSGKNQSVPPVVVPTRLQEVNAAAEDLRPIESHERMPTKS
jgi:excinuclease ABC subunit C